MQAITPFFSYFLLNVYISPLSLALLLLKVINKAAGDSFFCSYLIVSFSGRGLLKWGQ